MFFSRGRSNNRNSTIKSIDILQAEGIVNELAQDEMKNILGGRERMSRLSRLRIVFSDIMPQ